MFQSTNLDISIPPHTGLVLEGGGMRGAFTCGVLDYMLDHNIRFEYGVGVSAGACHGLSYMSRQRGRAKIAAIDMLERYNFIGLKYLWTQHSILDQARLYDEIPNRVLPFDYQACFDNKMEFEMVTTNCKTGRAHYFTERQSPERLLNIAKASSSLPFVCPIVEIDGAPMLDGGIVDSIPIERAIDKGYHFNIVVLTRNRGYRANSRDYKVPRFVYRDYPRLRVSLTRMNSCYNRQLELIDKLEAEGRILVIAPEKPMEVGRLENDTKKLTALYYEGYDCARKKIEGIQVSL